MSKELVASPASEWNALKEQATYAFKSGLLPQSIKTPEQAITIAAMGKELGLPIMASLTGIFVVNGIPTIKGQTMLRLIYERVPGAKITFLTPPEKSNDECEVEMQRPGGNPQRFKYTMTDAKTAGLTGKQPWVQHRSVMLRWSAVRIGARVVFSDAISGVYMPDEIEAQPKGVEADPIEIVVTQEPKAVEVIEPPKPVVLPQQKEWQERVEAVLAVEIPDAKPLKSGGADLVKDLLKSAKPMPPKPQAPKPPPIETGPKPMKTVSPDYVIDIGTYKGLKISEVPVDLQVYWNQCGQNINKLTGDDHAKLDRLMTELEKAIRAK